MKFAFFNADDAHRLAVDMRAVEAASPGSWDVNTAPILESYQLYSRRTACLSGYVFGHPSLSDGSDIMTSQLMYIDTEVGIARTVNRWYRLGRAPEIGKA